MNDLKDKVVEATTKVLDAGDKMKKDLKKNDAEAKSRLDAMNDKTKGKFEQAKGNVKEEIGKMTNNNKLQAEGMVEQVLGKAKEISGEIKESIQDAKNKVTK